MSTGSEGTAVPGWHWERLEEALTPTPGAKTLIGTVSVSVCPLNKRAGVPSAGNWLQA